MQPDWGRIEIEHPGLSIGFPRFLGEGWNARAYLVNDELVFRFPKRPEYWEEMQREIGFLAFAADQLPLAVPRYLRVAPDSPASACGYAVYGYLPGDAMDVRGLTPEERDAAADVIAGFLRALHSLEPSPAVDATLPREDARTVAEEYLAGVHREIVPKLHPSEARVLIERFQSYLSTPENFSFQPAVLHADLSRDHVLMQNGSVVAVIDFGDVNRGDPDYDFMYMFLDFGRPFIEEVARRYGHPDLQRLQAKLRYFALEDQVGTILNGAGRALAGQEREAWRRLAQLVRRPDGAS